MNERGSPPLNHFLTNTPYFRTSIASHDLRGTAKQWAVGRVEAKPCLGIWADNGHRKEAGFFSRILLGEMTLPPLLRWRGDV